MRPAQERGGVLHWARRRLQRQLSLIAAASVVLASGLFLVVVSMQYKSSILDAHGQASLNVNLLLQAALENAMIKRDLDGLQDIVARLGQQDNVAGVMIANPEGEVRFSSYPDMLFRALDDSEFFAAADSGNRHAGFRVLESGEEVLRSINPVHNQPRCTECHGAVADNPINGLLIVDYDSSGVRATVQRGAALLAALGFVVLLLLLAGLWIAVRRLVLARLNRLSGTARALAAGDLSVRSETGGADELAELGANFDEMADRLEANLHELQTAHASLQTLIDAIPDGVRVIDPEFSIVMANKAYCQQIGADPDTVVGQPCYASSHKRENRCVPTLVCCPVDAILRQGQTDLTCTHVHVDDAGSELSVELSAAAVTLWVEGREQRCVVESIRDMETDLSISHKQRLAEMGSLAAGVAHEVNNPLSSIGLVLRQIKMEADLSEEMRQNIEVAETEIGNCRAITESLLRLSALPQTERELVDLRTAIRDTASLLTFEAEQCGVSIELDVTGGPRVLARDSDMRNLVFNLALNAIHAMPDGGTLRIACRSEGDLVRLEVEDTGFGIPERDQDRVFMPFWTRRADGSRGRGLGLAICASIVKNLGGRIGLRSRLGVGTCFTIDLPSAGEAAT